MRGLAVDAASSDLASCGGLILRPLPSWPTSTSPNHLKRLHPRKRRGALH
jgi:hypothetical protein